MAVVVEIVLVLVVLVAQVVEVMEHLMVLTQVQGLQTPEEELVVVVLIIDQIPTEDQV